MEIKRFYPSNGSVYHIKGALKQYDPKFLQWDVPQDREANGKMIKGRPTRGFGNREFEYAGKLMTPEPWTAHPDVHDLLVEANKITKMAICDDWLDRKTFKGYDFCLVGLYRDGSEGIPLHSDTVPDIDDLVFSVSFGATRIFEWRQYELNIKPHSNTSKLQFLDHKLGEVGYEYTTDLFLMEHGDVLIFDGDSQMQSRHRVPELLGQASSRINLTFRSGL